MANAVTRRLLSRNLFKLNELTHFTNHSRCMSAFFVNFNHRNESLFYNKRSIFARRNEVQFFSNEKRDKVDGEQQLTLFQKFKQMYKNYWYVLVPVHLVTSAAWLGGFYYLTKSGVDVAGILESWNVSSRITSPLKDSSMGHIAISYALFKIATPARYTVTLGGTTISINYLKKWGYIKPVPSKEKLKEMYFEKKENLIETMKETRDGLKVQSEKFKDKKDHIIDDLDKGIKQFKELSGKVKNKEEHIVEEVKKKIKTSKEKSSIKENKN